MVTEIENVNLTYTRRLMGNPTERTVTDVNPLNRTADANDRTKTQRGFTGLMVTDTDPTGNTLSYVTRNV